MKIKVVYQLKIAAKHREKQEKKNIFLKTYIHFLREEKGFFMLLKAKYFQLKLKVQIFQTRSLTTLTSKY